MKTYNLEKENLVIAFRLSLISFSEFFKRYMALGLFLLVSLNAQAEQAIEPNHPYQSFPLGYQVIQKLEPGLYVAVTKKGMVLTHAIIKTAYPVEKYHGPINTCLFFVGVGQMKLQNGFDADANIFVDCTKEQRKAVGL